MHSGDSHSTEWMHSSIRPKNQQYLLGLDAAIILHTENATIAHPCVNKTRSKRTTQHFIFLLPPKMPPPVDAIHCPNPTEDQRVQKLIIVFIKITFLCWHQDEEKRRRGELSRQTRGNSSICQGTWDTSIKHKRQKMKITNDWGSEMKQRVFLVEYEISPVGSCL